jgi:hypothetical protein
MAEYILHFGGITIRVNGSGILRSSFIGLDDVIVKKLAPLTMSNTPAREPTILSNANGQRMRLKLETTDINEVMKVNRIVIWTKPMYTQFPQ